jgi:sugar phosphate isomerase/epimerase
LHPRLTILSRFASPEATLAEELEELARGGASRAGLSARRVTATAPALLAETGITATHLGAGGLLTLDGPPAASVAALETAIDAAASIGAPSVYGPTGGAPALEWDTAADAFMTRIASVLARARARDVSLLIEPTNPLFAHISILHTLRDTVDLAERSGVGVCIDVQHCWSERGLRDAIRAAAPLTGLVQFSDWIPGRRDHWRAVPGDGAIPLERILGWILENGYDGLFDLEVYPEPGVPTVETIARAIEQGGALLTRLGI